jgi:hypothetical protein
MADVSGTNIQFDEVQASKRAAPSIMVVDMDKRQSRKKIKRLRKGKGSLMEKVTEMVQELQENGAIEGGAQPVVIVVREKDRGWHMGPLGLK